MGDKFRQPSRNLEIRQSQASPSPFPAKAYLVKGREQYHWCPEYVYVIQWGDVGPVKIGIAVSPDQRLADLQSANWMTLNLIAVVPFRTGARLVEKKAHSLASEDCLRGEWFDLHPLDAIEAVLAAARELGAITVPLEQLTSELRNEFGNQMAEEQRKFRARQRRAWGIDD